MGAPQAAAVVAGSTSDRRSIVRSTVHLLTGQVATTALAIVLNAQLGRVLGPGDFGLYFFLLTSTYFVHVITEWGQGDILLREVARRPQQTAGLLGSALLIRVLLTVPVLTAGTLAVMAIGYEARTIQLFVLTIVAFVPMALSDVYGTAFRGHERMDIDARCDVLGKVLHVAFVSLAFALGGRLVSVILSLFASGVFSLVYVAWKVRDIGVRRLRVQRSEVRVLQRDGFPVLLGDVLGHAQLYTETLILSALATTEVLGWYGAARSISNTLLMPAAILLSASYPRLARAAVDRAALRSELGAGLRVVLILGVLVTTGTALFAEVAITLVYGQAGYGPATLILQCSGPLLFLLFLTMFLGSTVVIIGKARHITIVRAVVIPAAALATWLVVPRAQAAWGNGALGAIAVTTGAEVLVLGATIFLLPRGAVRGDLVLVLLRALLCAGVAAPASLLFDTPFLRIPLFLLVFAAGAFTLRLVRAEDVQTIRDAFRERGG